MEYLAETESEKTHKKYYLVGSVNRVSNNEKDEFLYFARDPNNKNHWYDSRGEFNLEKSPFLSIMETGQVIILFYTVEK